MKLSIITITYNNIEGLKSTFNSIVAQSWNDYEWIVIDGGSTDNTREFLEQNSDKFAFWCSEPDKGIYDAQNKGVKHATGDYLCFMNAGDGFIDNDILKTVTPYFGKADVLYGDTIFEDGQDLQTIIHPEQLTLAWLSRYTINHQSSFIRRELCERYPFDTKYKMLADRKFWLQCILVDKSFMHLPFITTLYDANGLSSRNRDKWIKEHQEICDELIPKSIQQALNSAHYYESSKDMQKAHMVLEKEGPMRKLLHLAINWIGKCRNIEIKRNQYAAIKK